MLVQHPEVKHWLIVGMNDNTVLGGVRATEGQGFKAPDVIGIGINGVDAVNELPKRRPPASTALCCQARIFTAIKPARCSTTGSPKALNRRNSPR
jgi:hypothetical protein